MKHLFFAIALALSFQSTQALAASPAKNKCLTRAGLSSCRLELTKDIFYCVTAFRTQKHKPRLVAEINCAKQAWKEFGSCVKPPTNNACVTTCQTQHTSNVNQCTATYDPALCGGDTQCEGILLAEQASCIEQANQTLNACVATCAQ